MIELVFFGILLLLFLFSNVFDMILRFLCINHDLDLKTYNITHLFLSLLLFFVVLNAASRVNL
jgi:hypothetical protein